MKNNLKILTMKDQKHTQLYNNKKDLVKDSHLINQNFQNFLLLQIKKKNKKVYQVPIHLSKKSKNDLNLNFYA